MAGSSTACAACSSLTGVLSHIFFSFIATGESESSAVATGSLKGNFWFFFAAYNLALIYFYENYYFIFISLINSNQSTKK